MNREKFTATCRELARRGSSELAGVVLDEVSNYREQYHKQKLPVIWLETSDSGDNNIAFLNTTYPYADRVFAEMIDLLYSNTLMAAQGENALRILEQAADRYRGEFVLVVEGAVPVKDNGVYNIIAFSKDRGITALEAVQWLGREAGHVLVLGTCGCFGGLSAARPNITGSVGVREILDREIINVSGCPVNPDWFVGTLAHLLMYGPPELDGLGRPVLFYGFTVHRHCQRRSYFDRGVFAEQPGDIECMYSQGCTGPRTGADCPYRQWINYVSWPVKANTPCIGCTNEDFPDGSSPFFTPLDQKGGRKGSGPRKEINNDR